MKLKLTALLAAVMLLGGCSSLTANQEELKKVSKVAIVGFTLDYSMPTGERFKSILMGKEHKMIGSKMGGSKIENRLIEKPISKKAYQYISKKLKETGWRVAAKSKVISNRTVKAFYNKRVKIGLLPLQSGTERYRVDGVPQYHYVQSLKKTPKLQAMAKELGVDALVFVYVQAMHGSAFNIGPFGIGQTKYHSNIRMEIYEPFSKKNIMKATINGKKIALEKGKKVSVNKTAHGSYLGVEKATDGLVTKMKEKL